jgi:hypothetical protein
MAFVSADTLLHFSGGALPLLSTLAIASQTVGDICHLAPVVTYAPTCFAGAAVTAATSFGDGFHVLVAVGYRLFTVTATGVVADFASLVLDPVGRHSSAFFAASLAFARPCETPSGAAIHTHYHQQMHSHACIVR